VEALLEDRPANQLALGRGPRQVSTCGSGLECACGVALVHVQALKQLDLRGQTQSEIDLWMEEARIDAILGSCSRSLPCVRSGARCFMAFVGARGRLRIIRPRCSMLFACCSRCNRPEGEAVLSPGSGDFAGVVDVVPVSGDTEQLPGLCQDHLPLGMCADGGQLYQ